MLIPCNVNFVANEKVKGKYYGKEFDSGKNHLHKIKSLKLPLEELAAYNHLAVFLRWMVEHDFIHEQLLEQIPNLKESKFYVFNREGYPSCVDNYAL